MPVSVFTKSPASSLRVVRTTHCPPGSTSSSTRALAFSSTRPEPRSFGRIQAGERVMRRRLPRMVTSSMTDGPRPGGAWSQRRLRALSRCPGTLPYSA
nr:hypothetical protein GCM10017588_00640 [Microbispora rosea subsp. aerata]